MIDLMELSRRGLEESFFAEQNALLRQRLIEADRQAARRAALVAASGITDEALLARILALGIDAEGLAALSMVPLLLVGWADGAVDQAERAVILKAAAAAHLSRRGRAQDLLEGWLHRAPPPALFEIWAGYVRAVVAQLDTSGRAAFRAHLLGDLRAVAEASGGFFGLGRTISDAEAKMVAKLEAAFAA